MEKGDDERMKEQKKERDVEPSDSDVNEFMNE